MFEPVPVERRDPLAIVTLNTRPSAATRRHPSAVGHPAPLRSDDVAERRDPPFTGH